jgi:arginase
MFDVDRLGIGNVLDEAIDFIGEDHNIHLSFDIDACDPFFAPATGTRNKVGGGLTFREANFLCESLGDTGRLTSMELVEVNSTRNTLSKEACTETVDVARGLITSALGSNILWTAEEKQEQNRLEREKKGL